MSIHIIDTTKNGLPAEAPISKGEMQQFYAAVIDGELVDVQVWVRADQLTVTLLDSGIVIPVMAEQLEPARLSLSTLTPTELFDYLQAQGELGNVESLEAITEDKALGLVA